MDERDQIKLPLPDKDTFACYPTEGKLNTLFDLLIIALKNQQDIFGMVQNNKRMNMTISGAFGVIGGAVAVAAKWLFTGQLR